MKSKMVSLFLIVLVGVICMQVLLMSQTAVVTALPPRPTATPEVPKQKGGLIELQLEGAAQDVWTLVQWQDVHDDWHDVDGWQGTIDEGNLKTWWVDEADLGKGPFRWVVLGKGSSVWISDSFYLPATPNEKVIVHLLLE